MGSFFEEYGLVIFESLMLYVLSSILYRVLIVVGGMAL